MKFDVADRSVHDDAFSIIKYSTGEMNTTEQAAKLTTFWTRFVEPFLGVRRAGLPDGGFVDHAAEEAAAAVLEESKADEKASKALKEERAAGGAGAGPEGGDGKSGEDGAGGEKGPSDKEEGGDVKEKVALGGLEEMAEGGGSENEGEDEENDDHDDEDKMDEEDEVGFDLLNDRRARHKRRPLRFSAARRLRLRLCLPAGPLPPAQGRARGIPPFRGMAAP
jgi:hypothetical protein